MAEIQTLVGQAGDAVNKLADLTRHIAEAVKDAQKSARAADESNALYEKARSELAQIKQATTDVQRAAEQRLHETQSEVAKAEAKLKQLKDELAGIRQRVLAG